MAAPRDQVCETAPELMNATRAFCRDVVREEFGVEWTPDHQHLLNISRDHGAGDLLDEFGELLRRMRALADDGRWPFGDSIMGVQAGLTKPIMGLVIGGVTEHAGKPECVVTQVLLDDELAWPTGLGERPVHTYRSRKDAANSDDTDRNWLVQQVSGRGFFCRCDELQPSADGGTCRRTEAGTVPKVLLSDGSRLRCAREATDRAVAAVYVLSQLPAYFADKLKHGRARAKDVLEAESDAIKQARRALGLPRRRGRRPK